MLVGLIVGDFRIPTFIAVGFWVASALAVTTYTVIAFKETATDLEGAVAFGASPLVASAAVLAADTVTEKPLERGKFQSSK